MFKQKYDLSKYIAGFISTPSGDRKEFIKSIANEVGATVAYVKKYLYSKDTANKVKRKVTTADLIESDRKLIKEKTAARQAETKYNHLLSEFEVLEQRFDALINIKESVEIYEIKKIEPTEGQNKATPIILLSDWHFEETVDGSTINGLNEYNLDIAAKRWVKCINNSLRLVNIDRGHSSIDDVVVWIGGDMITGYIHEELIESNSLSPTQAVRFTKQRLIAAFDFYLQHGKFKNIHVVCSYGNHGRTTIRKKFSTGFKNSFEWMLYHDISDYYKDEKRITFSIPNGIFTYINVYGYVLRFMHGDTIRYQGGIGGLTIPLIKAIHRYNQQIPAHYNFMGHYHQLFQATKDCIVNGSGIGYNAYAQGIGAGYEPPLQGYCLIDQKRGMTIKAPIFCE